MQGGHDYGAFCKKNSLHITIHLSSIHMPNYSINPNKNNNNVINVTMIYNNYYNNFL